MKTIRYNKTLVLIFAMAITVLNACSYAVDMVERTLTKRASFSITAEYSGDSVIVRWSESGSGNFAGYEVYITEEPDNEYAGYVVIGAGYTISSSSIFTHDSNLLNGFTQSFTMGAAQVSNLKTQNGSGRYFFRVGIIDWDEDPDERTPENGYTGDTEQDYIHNTDIAEISGLAMVDIY